MFKRPQYIVFIVVVLVALVLLNLPGQTSAQLKLAFSSLFLPLFSLASSTQSLVEQGGSAVVPRGVLVRELEDLRQENRELRLRAAQTEELAQENNRLRQLLRFPAQLSFKLRAARVVGGDPSNWWRGLMIDRGSRDGLRANLTVVAPDGSLVGRVVEANLAQSQVVLAGDPRCRFSVLIQETRDHGVIVPGSESTLESSFLTLAYLSRSAQIKPGQTVVTSGLGGIFPKGLRVGEIVDYRSVDYDLYWEARVKRAVNIHQLEEVLVLVP